MSGLCPYCKRSKTKLIKYRTEDYDPKNRRIGDVYFVEKKVAFCCLTRFFINIVDKIKNLF